ncbi:hypothetical protein ABTF64_19510, partial [Acinetobacter baumannii]
KRKDSAPWRAKVPLTQTRLARAGEGFRSRGAHTPKASESLRRFVVSSQKARERPAERAKLLAEVAMSGQEYRGIDAEIEAALLDSDLFIKYGSMGR